MVFTEPLWNARSERERAVEMWIETFGASHVLPVPPAVLALYASGSLTGLVLDAGLQVSHAVPVYEGHALAHAVRRSDVGGADVDAFLARAVDERLGGSASTPGARAAVTAMKEQLAFVAQNADEEEETARVSSYHERTFALPDGHSVSIGAERFRCGEVLFHPASSIGREVCGVHELVYGAVMRCSVDIRRTMYNAIVVAGGATCMPGFQERLHVDVMNLAPPGARVHVSASPERPLSAWIGGSILASLSTFHGMAISRAEYDEDGPSIVHRKCF